MFCIVAVQVLKWEFSRNSLVCVVNGSFFKVSKLPALRFTEENVCILLKMCIQSVNHHSWVTIAFSLENCSNLGMWDGPTSAVFLPIVGPQGEILIPIPQYRFPFPLMKHVVFIVWSDGPVQLDRLSNIRQARQKGKASLLSTIPAGNQ